MSSAKAQATNPADRFDAARAIELPLENLSLQETLRVMDVAREMRTRRETAEEMFRRDDLRSGLRDKLLRNARLTGDTVTEAEIDAAIGQYMDTLHTFHDPEPGMSRFLAHCWVWRDRIMAGAVVAATIAGSCWFLFT